MSGSFGASVGSGTATLDGRPESPSGGGSTVTIVHHDLCFGCGHANLFGLQIELEPVEEGVAGRFFVKQDHQGPPGQAHGGVIGAALDEAMALAVHTEALAYTARIEVDLVAPAPVGTFVALEARVERRSERKLETVAVATVADEGTRVAEARATFVRAPAPADAEDATAAADGEEAPGQSSAPAVDRSPTADRGPARPGPLDSV